MAEAVTQLRAIVEVMGGHLLRSFAESTAMYQVGRNTTRLLMAAGDVLLGWLPLRQAAVAESKLAERPDGPNAPDAAFYRGKIATARFFAQEVLPLPRRCPRC